MKARPRILFISHSASRNGASILLLTFLRWLRANAPWDLDVLVHGSGPLVSDFSDLATTHVFRNASRPLSLLSPRWSGAVRSRVYRWGVRALLAGREYDLIYANTAAAWPYVDALRTRRRPLLWHIHELTYALRLEMPDVRARELLSDATAVVAVSSSVRDMLAGEYQLPARKIETVPEFVPVPVLSDRDRTARRRRVLDRLSWPADAFVVGGCGSIGWRKGTDLFLQIARSVAVDAKYQRVRFLWVGDGLTEKDALEFQHDLQSLGLDTRCVRVAAQRDVLDYYCAMDAFALTSREDPFPLVMLEAGATALPTICFAGSGGGPEFVGSDAGLVAPCQDVAAFARHVMLLHDDPGRRDRLGAAALAKVQTNHTAAAQAPRLSRLIERHLAMSAPEA